MLGHGIHALPVVERLEHLGQAPRRHHRVKQRKVAGAERTVLQPVREVRCCRDIRINRKRCEVIVRGGCGAPVERTPCLQPWMDFVDQTIEQR